MVSIVHPRSDVQALYDQTDLLIQELTDWARPLPEDKLARIRVIAQNIIGAVPVVLRGGWDIAENREVDQTLRNYELTLIGLYPHRLNPYPHGYRLYSDEHPMDAHTRELLIAKGKVADAVRELRRLRDPIPTARLISLPPEEGCCAVQ